ncbi:MAG TPA: cation transporter [Candidatus Binataceae bacterium]|nr:cation transporter [Candidatus Binataceae bacterium]
MLWPYLLWPALLGGCGRATRKSFPEPDLITVLTIPVMYGLAKRKMYIADKIGSRALRADAVESIACGYLSVVVVGLSVQWFLGLWWIDSVTSLAIVVFLIREGREAWTGKECSVGR